MLTQLDLNLASMPKCQPMSFWRAIFVFTADINPYLPAETCIESNKTCAEFRKFLLDKNKSTFVGIFCRNIEDNDILFRMSFFEHSYLNDILKARAKATAKTTAKATAKGITIHYKLEKFLFFRRLCSHLNEFHRFVDHNHRPI